MMDGHLGSAPPPRESERARDRNDAAPGSRRSAMLPLDKQFAASIDHVSRALAEWTVSSLYDRRPEFETSYGASGRTLWKSEIVNRLQHLAARHAEGWLNGRADGVRVDALKEDNRFKSA